MLCSKLKVHLSFYRPHATTYSKFLIPEWKQSNIWFCINRYLLIHLTIFWVLSNWWWNLIFLVCYINIQVGLSIFGKMVGLRRVGLVGRVPLPAPANLAFVCRIHRSVFASGLATFPLPLLSHRIPLLPSPILPKTNGRGQLGPSLPL